MKTLKQLREEQGFTCKQVAEFLGITEVHYWYIENGKRRAHFDRVSKIATLFGVKLDDIKIF